MTHIRKHSLEENLVPTPESLAIGEVMINNHDGLIYFKADDGSIVELREQNKLYNVNSVEERNNLALDYIMRNGDYVMYTDRGFNWVEIFFDERWFTMYKKAV